MTVLHRGVPNFPAEVNWLLEEGYFGYLGTSDSRGNTQVTPVIFVREADRVFLTISKVSKKVANIRQNERVAFLVDIRDPSDPANNRAILIEGRAKIYGIFDVLNEDTPFVDAREIPPIAQEYGDIYLENRNRVFDRDGNHCTTPRCNERVNLVTHHIEPVPKNQDFDPKWVHRVENLITKCTTCHKKIHRRNRR